MRRFVATCLAAFAVGGVLPRAGATDPPPLPLALVLATPAVDMNAGRAPTTATAALELRILRNANKYALTVWWDEWVQNLDKIQAMPALMKHGDVRRYASEAYSLATSLATGAYSESVTGVPRAVAIQRTLALVHAMVVTHRAYLGSVNDVGWGGTWQSGLWAALLAEAGWLLGPALPPADATGVARMLELEADAVVARPLHYLRDRDGRVLTPGDTGAEELAWDGMLLEVATELLPYHPRRALWARAAYQRMIGAYARPGDVRSTRVVNGRTVSSWLGGSNAESHGLVVNHWRLHPDYAACVGFNLFAATVTALVGDGMPDAALANARETYVTLTSTPFRGKPIYVPGSAEIRYPWGTDWGTDRQIVYGTLDVQMAALGLDRGFRTTARTWAMRHLSVVARMQSRSKTGQTYRDGDDNTYPQREELLAMHAAWAYLTDWVAANRLVRKDTAPASSKAPATPVPVRLP